MPDAFCVLNSYTYIFKGTKVYSFLYDGTTSLTTAGPQDIFNLFDFGTSTGAEIMKNGIDAAYCDYEADEKGAMMPVAYLFKDTIVAKFQKIEDKHEAKFGSIANAVSTKLPTTVEAAFAYSCKDQSEIFLTNGDKLYRFNGTWYADSDTNKNDPAKIESATISSKFGFTTEDQLYFATTLDTAMHVSVTASKWI